MKSHKAEKLLRVAEYCSALIAACAIALIMVALLADTIARYFLGGSIPGASNFAAEYLLIIAVYFALVYTWSTGQHASVELVAFDRWRWAKPALRVVNLAVTVFVLLMIIYANLLAMQAANERGMVSAGSVPFPIWPAYLLICIGAVVFLVAVLLRLGKPRVADDDVPEGDLSAGDGAVGNTTASEKRGSL